MKFQRKHLAGVMGLSPVNDGALIGWLIINQNGRTSKNMLHPGNKEELLRYAKGFVEHAGFFKIEQGNVITISQV
jgi:hypothetical protein